MKTGDIIIYQEPKKVSRWWFIGKAISEATHSPWVHVGIILKDPKWLGLKGTYIWESAWTGIPDSVDRVTKFGVQVVPFDQRIVPGITYHREYTGPEFNQHKMKEIYDELLNKPYDINPVDWVEALTGYDPDPQREKRFWCSALVACILTKIGLLDEDTDWTITVPKYFADPDLKFYGPIKQI